MKAKIAIPIMIALIAAVTLALPPAMAEFSHDGEYKHSKYMWKDGMYHKKDHIVEVTGFEGSLKITDNLDKHALKDKVTVSLSEATAAYPDAKKASLGMAINENDDKFLVWQVIEKNYDHETHILTKTIHVVDAGDADNTASVTKQIDKTEKMQKMTQFKEIKQAFNALSAEDRDTLKSHFKEMREQFQGLTDDQRAAKYAEHKQQMETFAQLTLQEKINYLQYLAVSIRNQQ